MHDFIIGRVYSTDGGEINDARLLKTALERMGKFDSDSLISQEEIDKKFGFTPEMLEEGAEIEFE